tara:strand:- start:78 stop:338 length:261 start_codon:yes stop_codon:yes gene_type:complete
MLTILLMLVYFQFRRCGYYAKGLVEADNLDAASKALWAEHVGTFKWEDQVKDMPENANTLTIEEYKYERSSDGKTEPEKEFRSQVG